MIASDLKILKKRFTVNRNIVTTNEDNVVGVNIQSFGSCKFGGSCKLNSELMGSKLEWTNYIKNIKLMGEYKKSKILLSEIVLLPTYVDALELSKITNVITRNEGDALTLENIQKYRAKEKSLLAEKSKFKMKN